MATSLCNIKSINDVIEFGESCFYYFIFLVILSPFFLVKKLEKERKMVKTASKFKKQRQDDKPLSFHEETEGYTFMNDVGEPGEEEDEDVGDTLSDMSEDGVEEQDGVSEELPVLRKKAVGGVYKVVGSTSSALGKTKRKRNGEANAVYNKRKNLAKRVEVRGDEVGKNDSAELDFDSIGLGDLSDQPRQKILTKANFPRDCVAIIQKVEKIQFS